MSEGDRPNPPPRPSNPPGGPPKFEYSELPAGKRRRVREVFGPAFREELAEYLAEQAANHVRAA